MRISRIPHRIFYHAKRLTYANKTNSPFVSPDTFKKIADLDLDTNFYPGIEKVRNAEVIFINSGDIKEFFDEYGNIIGAKVLIFGNNDVDFTEFNFSIPRSIRRIYLQNSMIEDQLFRLIPIGIESLSYVTNGLPKLFSSKYPQIVKKKRMLVGPFGDTHQERSMLFERENEEFLSVDFIKSRLTPKAYAEISASYSLIACPRGNGLDTHRFWEALYRGSIPVVIASPWSSYWLRSGVPIIEIPSWGCDLDLVLNNKLSDLKFVPSDIDVLWESHWLTEIREGL